MNSRQIVHISMAGFALCIGRLSPIMVFMCCVAVFLFNLWVLPRLTQKALEHSSDRKRGFSIGMISYPASLAVLSLLFYKQQIYLAIAWGCMAFGDAAASIIGSKFKSNSIPWNKEKTISGFLAFMGAGFLGTLLLIYFLPYSTWLNQNYSFWITPIMFAVIVAATAETIPGLIDDNIAVPFTGAFAAYFFTEFTLSATPTLPSDWWLGFIAVLTASILSVVFSKIDIPGAFAGFFIAFSIYLGGGFASLTLLLFFFVAGSLASKFKIKQKQVAGIAEANKGKRSVGNAIANGGIAAICGILATLFPFNAELFLLMLAASLASATADTLASELGNIYGNKYWNILTLKPDKRGLDGVISLEGTLFGALGSLAIALLYAINSTWQLATVVFLAGIAGNFIDSILGATLQSKGYMTNSTVNFTNTLLAALLAYILH